MSAETKNPCNGRLYFEIRVIPAAHQMVRQHWPDWAQALQKKLTGLELITAEVTNATVIFDAERIAEVHDFLGKNFKVERSTKWNAPL